jgi:hypothetical protein
MKQLQQISLLTPQIIHLDKNHYMSKNSYPTASQKIHKNFLSQKIFHLSPV